MRQSRMISLVVLLVASPFLVAQEPGRFDRDPGQRPAGRDPVEFYLGDVLVRTDGARVLVMVDTITARGVAPDGLVDQWFVLETAGPSTPIFAHLSDALLVHSPGALRVTTTEQQFDFMLSDGDASLPAPRGLEAITTRTVGIGLSHNKGATAIRLAGQLDRAGRVATTCEGCEVLNPDDGGLGAGGGNCDSGGPGSTSCSVSAGTSGYSCSVSCSAGYYACCLAQGGRVSCKCKI